MEEESRRIKGEGAEKGKGGKRSGRVGRGKGEGGRGRTKKSRYPGRLQQRKKAVRHATSPNQLNGIDREGVFPYEKENKESRGLAKTRRGAREKNDGRL